MRKNLLIVCFLNLITAFICIVNAQSINISDFYYRDYLDFGQHKGAFGANNSTITKKDGTEFQVPQVPNFCASSNYGSLTSAGRGFAVTANHVSSPESDPNLRKWGLTQYEIAKQPVQNSSGDIGGTSKIYGYDTKFWRLDKYVVEGQVEMLNIDNTKTKDTDEQANIKKFREQVENSFKDDKGNIYLYQAGSGIVTLRGTSNQQTFNTNGSGEMKGGGFGTLGNIEYYNAGMGFYYIPQAGFYNQITSGDSGSGIYAYDKDKNEWILLGVVSRDNGAISVASNKDFRDYQQNFEQNIDLQNQLWTLKGNDLENNSLSNKTLQGNKDLIFSGGGTIQIEKDIDRMQSGYAGGFVFKDSTTSTTYTFQNKNGKTYSFNGSGLDIGENVVVEWALRNKSGESLHKVGKGELIIKTDYTPTNTSENLGTLKIGEGKVTLDTDKKAYDNIYITSGRGELTLTQGKAEALGASKNTARGDSPNADYHTLSQDTTSEMGFYFGTGGGKLDLGGNSLTLNTIAANDSGATITSTANATLEIQGFGYDDNDNKTSTKKDTIIHASVGESNATNGTNQANIDIVYSVDKNANNAVIASERSERRNLQNSATLQSGLPRLSTESLAMTRNSEAHLIFDGNISTSGKMEVTNGNIALQGHATAHATISNGDIRNQVANAESGTQKGMPDYIDLSKPSHLAQPDWDNRSFKFGTSGIDLKNSTLTLGRNASLKSNITLDSSSNIKFGGSVTHFIDNLDGKNVTGSGFSYQQKVESGKLSAEQTKIANQTISYKGTITANGGTIQSHIWDFNASLDLKDSAKLSADYLTLTNTDSVTLAGGASATIQNLILKNVNDLSKLNVNGDGAKFEVQKSFWFDNSTFDLQKLDLASGLTKSNNYDIVAFNGSQISGNSLTFQSNVLLQGGNSTSSTTKLTLTNALKAENAENATIVLSGKSEIIAPKIEFSGVKNGILALDSEAKLTGANGNVSVEVSGENSTLKIGMLGDKSFNINAQGGSTIFLSSLRGSVSNEAIQNENSGLPRIADSNSRNDKVGASVNFSGKITAKDSSIITTALESITASVDLSGSANLVAKNIELTNGFDSIKLSSDSKLTADIITAKNLSNLTLNATNSANVDIKSFIFDGGTTNLTGNIIGKNIILQNSSIVKNSDLSFSGDMSVTFDDTDSKLEVTNLKVTSGNLSLNFADSTNNAEKITKIDLSGGNLTINSWDFGNTTAFSSSGDNSRVTFQNATYTQNNGAPKSISVDSTISDNLTLLNVGGDSSKGNDRFKTLTFSDKNLTFGENAKIQVNLDSSIKKGANDITLDTYFTLLSAGSVSDNRADKRIDFRFASAISESEKLFVVSKFYENKLLVKFLESNPRSFSELSKHISRAHTKTLLALTEHNPNDENIDKAARTEEYSALESTLASYEEAMREIATQSSGENLSAILQNNDLSIKMRILQVRAKEQNLVAQNLQNPQARQNLRLAFAMKNQSATKATAYTSPNATQSDYDDTSLLLGVVPKSSLMPSLSLYQNSAWASALGGYAGTSGLNLAFYGSSVGYDRIVGSTLLGIMASFGGSHLLQKSAKQNGIIAGGGAYLHTQFGKSEIQSSLSFAYSSLESSAFGDNIKSSVFGGFWSNYYKYNITLLDGNILKPLGLIGLGISKASDWRGEEFRGGGFGDVFAHIGAGLEYVIFRKRGFYTVGLVGAQKLHSQSKAQISFAKSSTMLDFVVNNNAFEVQGYFIGLHTIKERLNIEYAIHINGDTRGYYGTKGSVGFRYAF